MQSCNAVACAVLGACVGVVLVPAALPDRPAAQPRAAGRAVTIAIPGGTLIDGTEAMSGPERIHSIGPADSTRVPAGALVIRADGKFVLPVAGTDQAAGLPPHELDRIKVGNEAPDFTLQDQDGHRVSLSSLRGQKFVILNFYRGHW